MASCDQRTNGGGREIPGGLQATVDLNGEDKPDSCSMDSLPSVPSRTTDPRNLPLSVFAAKRTLGQWPAGKRRNR
jgi:hypothetical protein